jgi:hypothetical protein
VGPRRIGWGRASIAADNREAGREADGKVCAFKAG